MSYSALVRLLQLPIAIAKCAGTVVFMRRLLLISSLSLAAAMGLSACGTAAATTTSTTYLPAPTASAPVSIYIDEAPGMANGQDAPLLDKFWFSNNGDDITYSATTDTSYSVDLNKGASIKFINQGDDPEKITITGPNDFVAMPEIAEGPNTSTTITLPSVAGAYEFTSTPDTEPARPGAQGGIANLS